MSKLPVKLMLVFALLSLGLVLGAHADLEEPVPEEDFPFLGLEQEDAWEDSMNSPTGSAAGSAAAVTGKLPAKVAIKDLTNPHKGDKADKVLKKDFPKGEKSIERKWKLEGPIDDPEDQDVNAVNSEGANKLTGDADPSTTKIIKNGDQAGQIKPPGYTTADQYVGQGGHLYIGLSRRRIGAGFGRRRGHAVKPDAKGEAKKQAKAATRLQKTEKADAAKAKVEEKAHKIERKDQEKAAKKTDASMPEKAVKAVHAKHAGDKKTFDANDAQVKKFEATNTAEEAKAKLASKKYLVQEKKDKQAVAAKKKAFAQEQAVKAKAKEKTTKEFESKHITVIVTTGKRKNAQSGQTPKIRIIGSNNGKFNGMYINGHIKIGGVGETMTTYLKMADCQVSPGQARAPQLGKPVLVYLDASSTDGWEVTRVQVKSGKLPVTDFGCMPYWLDGKPWDKPSSYGPVPYVNHLQLEPGFCKTYEEIKVRVTTGTVKYAESGQTPTITLTGSKGSFTGKISIAGKGASKTTSFFPSPRKIQKGALSSYIFPNNVKQAVGYVTKVDFSASSKDGWLITKVEVDGFGPAKADFKEFGCLPQWLDGKPYDTSPYGFPYANKLTVHQGACKSSFPAAWGWPTQSGCFCKNKCSTHGDAYTWCRTRDGCKGHASSKGNWDKCDKPSIKVRVTTGDEKYADSKQKPTIKLIGSKGIFSGKISLAGKGKSKVTTLFTSKDIGVINNVVLVASSKDGWLVTKVEVNPFKRGYKSYGCLPYWLDGKDYDESAYSHPYGDTLNLKLSKSKVPCKSKFPASWGKPINCIPMNGKTHYSCFCANNQLPGRTGYCTRGGYGGTFCRTRDNCFCGRIWAPGATGRVGAKWNWAGPCQRL